MSDVQRRYVTLVESSIGDIRDTVTRLRSFYRKRDLEEAWSPVNLNAVVRAVLDLSRPQWRDIADRGGITIEVEPELAEDLPVIQGNASEIRQAVMNLVLNAIHAMPEGGRLAIRTFLYLGKPKMGMPRGRAADGGDQICVEIADTGVGMDEATLARCFDPFFTTKGQEGTGLGLAIVYGTLQRHGGEVEVESAPGEGTTVRLRFPVRAEDGSAAEETPPRITLPALRVLLIDDAADVLAAVTELLEAEGHIVHGEQSGQAGLDVLTAAQAEAEPFDVVITDLGMPVMDGRKVAQAVKALPDAPPVILMTGWGHQLRAEDDVPAEVDALVNKPPDPTALMQALARVIGARAST